MQKNKIKIKPSTGSLKKLQPFLQSPSSYTYNMMHLISKEYKYFSYAINEQKKPWHKYNNV